MHQQTTGRLAARVCVSLAFLACAGGNDAPATDTPLPSPSAAATGEVQPDPGGRVITVEMVTDEKGSYFEPAEIDAKPGDVVRFSLKAGVHNVNFLPDSNAVRDGLPRTSDMLQLPGQTHDVKVSLPAGSHFFQCDPHAMLGMIGRLHVR